MANTEPQCKCWFPVVMENIAEDGSYFDYCDRCGEWYLRDVEPHKDALMTLNEVHKSIKQLNLDDKRIEVSIFRVIKLMQSTD